MKKLLLILLLSLGLAAAICAAESERDRRIARLTIKLEDAIVEYGGWMQGYYDAVAMAATEPNESEYMFVMEEASTALQEAVKAWNLEIKLLTEISKLRKKE